MAEIRPFRGLRYNPAKVAQLGSAMSPPYDVISPALERELVEKSPYNVVQVELAGENNDAQAFARASTLLAQWRKEEVLIQEEQPAIYLTRHEFTAQGKKKVRTEVTAAVRLEEAEKDVILPHEATRARAKDDRLNLLRATRTNVSPVFMLHDQPQLKAPATPALVADMGKGERFSSWAVTDPAVIARYQKSFAQARLYIADGHHRYATALNYRNETKAQPSDAASFVMADLVSFSDPGLIVGGYHRLFHGLEVTPMSRLRGRIGTVCRTQHVAMPRAMPEQVAQAATEAFQSDKALFVGWGLAPGSLTLLTLADNAAVDEIAARGHSKAWAGLPNCVFREALLFPALAMQEEEAETQGLLTFSHDAAEAVRAVNTGEAQLAILCKPVPFDAFKEVAERGELLPPKSTFFYPKLPTGLVMKSVEGML